MRLPRFSELSEEQLDVFQAPLEGAMIVVGPPGSGKTVVALFRHESARKASLVSRVVVFNNVLKAYTGVERTFHAWLRSWWYAMMGRNYPTLELEERTGFRPPDFDRMTQEVTGPAKEVAATKGHWGHLILDEAQDFAIGAHRLLGHTMMITFAEQCLRERPSATVLADDNQRITESNSTIADMREAYSVSSESVYELRQNYRNTREISRVASLFYVGTSTGIPEEPRRRGNKPSLILTKDLNDAVQRIVSYAKGHPEQEIGVLVQYSRTRKRIFNKLSYRLQESSLTVQTYDGSTRSLDVEFDRPGTVTVLTFASSKGLEFDSVFLPELQTLNLGGSGADHARMNLYVMCSRARANLSLMLSDDGSRRAELWSYLPSEPKLSQLFDVM